MLGWWSGPRTRPIVRLRQRGSAPPADALTLTTAVPAHAPNHDALASPGRQPADVGDSATARKTPFGQVGGTDALHTRGRYVVSVSSNGDLRKRERL
jgi:hypothetical protein